MALFLATDIIQPPYCVSPSGEYLTTQANATCIGASDTLAAFIFESFGVQFSPIMFYLVYFVTPVLLTVASVMLLSEKKFFSLFSGVRI